MLFAHDKRRHEPSYSTPLILEGLEVLMIRIVFSIFEGTFNIVAWSLLSYMLASVWFLYTFYKLTRVLDRQNMHKW